MVEIISQEELIIYFAHAINLYDMPLEAAVEYFIWLSFPKSKTENPNQSHHQDGYRRYAKLYADEPVAKGTRGMRYFHEIVLPSCNACVTMPFLDGRIGLGAADEPAWYLERDMPVWFIEPTRIPNKEELKQFIEDPSKNNIFQIRPFNAEEIAMLLNIEPKVGSRLVLSHKETRLRTWKIYNQLKRLFEEAHLAPTEVYPGFYPDEK